MTILTLVALFGDDLNVICFDKSADYGFDIGQLVIMSLFLVEVLLSSIAINGYLFSFFFWLDVLSSVSMLMDINIFTDIVFSTYGKNYAAALHRPATFPRLQVSRRLQGQQLGLSVSSV